jgi:hypothetical protein
MQSDGQGNFLFTTLTLGVYSVKVEKAGFKVAEVKNVEVFTGRTNSIRVTLQPGVVAETVEVNAPAVTVDPYATGVGANLHDKFYEQVPVTRNVSGIFYITAGVASGGRSGVANPSISGGSGLENLYVADGSLFVTSGGVNPTPTITALALKVARGIADGASRQQTPV